MIKIPNSAKNILSAREPRVRAEEAAVTLRRLDGPVFRIFDAAKVFEYLTTIARMISLLVENKYDLSKSMGNLLIENFDFSNIDVIKPIYRAMFSDDELSKSLKEAEIWKLYQRRNLIVHRGGVIDKKYFEKTGDGLELGTKLFIKPNELRLYIENATLIGTQLAKAAQSSKTK